MAGSGYSYIHLEVILEYLKNRGIDLSSLDDMKGFYYGSQDCGIIRDQKFVRLKDLSKEELRPFLITFISQHHPELIEERFSHYIVFETIKIIFRETFKIYSLPIHRLLQNKAPGLDYEGEVDELFTGF